MKLKRILSMILLFIIAMSSLFVSGCFSCSNNEEDEIEKRFETDGVFKYCKITEDLPQASKFEGTYALCGQERVLEKKVVIPAYYKGVPVTQIMLEGPEKGIWVPNNYTWSPTFYGAEVVFMPYSVGFDEEWAWKLRYFKELFAPISKISLSKIDWSLWVYFDDPKSIFLGDRAFCSLIEQMDINKMYPLNIINDYTLSVILDKFADNPLNTDLIIHRANTTYCFNYEDSPNDDVFFINDFERGGKIENTPYEPLREGYKFAGWYKEPECINAWDFEKDALPVPEYYQDGELKFIETKLYAKWEEGSVTINPVNPGVKEELGTKVEYIVKNNTIIGANNYVKEKVTELEIPSEVNGQKITAIGDFVFRGYDNLKNVVINEGIEKIGNEAFAWCENLIKVQIPESVIDVGERAFKYCFSLRKVNLPSKIAEIKIETFACCTVIPNIDIPQGVEIIREGAFKRCEYLESISIPNNTRIIESEAFRCCYKLTTLTIGENLTKIGDEAFSCCRITELILCDNLIELGNFVFSDCDALKNVIISSGLKTIGKGCFYYCLNVKNLFIPKSVEEVGVGAFLLNTNAIIKCEALEKPQGWADNCAFQGEMAWGCVE